jgi:oligopeptide/dipeptide ABC transporter ATP-binding protein
VTNLLDVRDLHVHFSTKRGVVRAVDGVSFELAEGETLGIVGESGSGKTVLSRAVMGLIPRGGAARITGDVFYDGNDLMRLDPRELRRLWGSSMAMIFQDPMTSLNPVKRIGVQITESLRHHLGMSAGAAKAKAVGLLSSVGISEPERRIRQFPHQLSGGMRQRVTIAIALACSPRLVFADEPTTALDVTVQAQILDLLDEQQSARQMAMILVTHDLGVVRGHAERIIVMYAGQVVESAPAHVLFQQTRMPYTEALIDAVPSLEGPIHVNLRAIPGRPPDLINPPTGCRFSPRCTYATDRCRTEAPPLVADDGAPDHLYRCWYPVGGPAWRAARAGADEVRT